MKKVIFCTTLLLLVSFLFCGCLPEIMVIPNKESIGNSKTFQKVGITLTLTDRFEEQQSQLGFDAYYVADFCGVVVLKEPFTLEEGLGDKPLEEYIRSVMDNNGHTDEQPQFKDGLWFYENTTDRSFIRSYCYKGTDAFYIVQYICSLLDAERLKDLFTIWGQAVEVE